jgi:hypothetical protein
MKKIDPVFPLDLRDEIGSGTMYFGLSVRDYFAAKAMQGWLTTFPTDCAVQDVRPSPIALFAYEMADAMIKEREAK